MEKISNLKNYLGFKSFLIFFVFMGFILISFKGVYAETITTEFVDVTYVINSKDYVSKGITKKLDVGPYIDSGRTLVPFRSILEELGYVVEWDAVNKFITCTKKGDDTIKLQINNNTATIGTAKKNMEVAPKVVAGRTFVPLRFISENAGASVVWDGNKKSIYISKVPQYKTGTVMFYEKGSNKDSKVYVYDGTKITIVPIEDKEIKNWRSYKGKVLATIFNPTTNNNDFSIFKDDKFETLIKNFDMKDTFEFNNNLLIHGYDREQKFDKLYRFDGDQLILVEDNFYVGNRYVFKDKLIINKYNNNRQYSLLEFSKTSWKPVVLKEEFIIKESFQDEHALYMAGAWQEGGNKPLASYDGNKFIILHPNLTVNIKGLVMFSGKLHVVHGGNLITIEKDTISNVLFPVSSGIYANYKVNTIMYYKDKKKLIIGVNTGGPMYYDSSVKTTTYTFPKDKKHEAFVLALNEGYSYEVKTKGVNPTSNKSITVNSNAFKNILDKFLLLNLYEEKDLMLMTGTETDDNDSALNIYNGTDFTKALDVTKVRDYVSVGGKTFIHVDDSNRITNLARSTVIVYENKTIKNLVVGFKPNQFSTVKDSLLLYGLESDINRTKVYSYGKEFTELLDNFESRYWTKFGDIIFVNGLDKNNQIQYLYKFNDENLNILKEQIRVNKMIKAKGSYYFMDTNDFDKKTEFYGKRILFIYDEVSDDFIIMKVNLNISDMLFVEE